MNRSNEPATSARWARIRELYHAALDLPGDQRLQFVASACRDQPEVEAEVCALLKFESQSSGFLESPFAGTLAPCVPNSASWDDRLIGQRLGGYTIRRVLGRGGIGVVYEAEQNAPRRTVALKVMRLLPLVDKVTERLFRREGHALARLEHPGIARVYETGVTDDGWCYLAMELIQGEPLTQFVRRTGSALSQKLELFQKLCEAVHYAHQRGIIHRDLKPPNILATEAGAVRVLDFGLARFLDPDSEFSTLQSESGAVQGTLPYLSPEQIRGQPVDIRGDVYALGVVLYELLYAKLPLDVRGMPLTEAARIICDDTPRISRVLTAEVDADLETVVLKALEKAPERRYDSVAAFAQDIDRWTNHLPILARPPSALYHVRKFVARRRAVCLLGAALAMVIVTSAVVNGVLATRYARERNAAQAASQREAEARQSAEQARQSETNARATAEKTAEFLQGLFQNANPGNAEEPEITARGLLRRGVDQLENDHELQPEVRAQLAATLGSIFSGLDEMPEAQRLLEQSLELRRQALGEAHPDVGNSLMKLALLHMRLNDREKALRAAGEAIDILQNHFGEQHERTASAYNDLATIHFNSNDMKSAEENFRRALVIGTVIHVEPTLAEALNHYNLGYALIMQERMDEGEQEMNSALQTYRKLGDQAGANTVLNGLAQVAFRRKNTVQAEAYMQEAVETSRQIRHAEHPRLLWEIGQLAFLVNQNGRTEEALSIYEELVSTQRRVLGPKHRDVGQTLIYMATIQSKLGKHSLAVSYQSEAVAIWQSLSAMPVNGLLIEKANLARYRCNAGQFAEAEAECRSILQQLAQVDEPQPWIIVESHAQLARALDGQGRRMEAEEHALFALDLANQKVEQSVPGLLHVLGIICRNRGDFELAESYFRAGEDRGRNAEGQLDLNGVVAVSRLGQMLVDLGRADEAEAILKEAVARICDVESTPSAITALARTALGHFFLERSLPAEATIQCIQAIEILENQEEPNLLAEALRCHGTALIALGDPVSAETILRRSMSLIQSSTYSPRWLTAQGRTAIGLCLIELGRTDEAREEFMIATPLLAGFFPRESPVMRQYSLAIARIPEFTAASTPIELQLSTHD